MISKDKLEKLKALSPEEYQAAVTILKQYAENGESELFDELKYSDFEEIPVDIDTFLDDDDYLGHGIWQVDEFTGERKCTLFPYWRATLHRLFPDNLTTSYNTLILTGAIGLGKTLMGVLAQLYLLYRMLCLKDPYTYYGMMPSDKITFSMLNITLDAAQGVGWDKMQQLLQGSPWFMAHGNINASRTNPQWQPPKGVELIFGSNNRHVVGRALFCLDGDTEILTSTGNKKLKALVDSQIKVISIDENGNKVLSDTCTVKPTVQTMEEYQIELENGTIIKCTSNHRLMLKNGTYKEAQYLTEEDELMDIQSSYFEYIDNIIKTRGQWGIGNGEYYEGHHIIPKCFKGKGTTKAKHPNIIRLYPEEHFIAHKLLAIENSNNRALVNAWEMMAYPKGKTERNYQISEEDYALLRRLWSNHMAVKNPGLCNEGHPWNYGIKKEKALKIKKDGKKGKVCITNGSISYYINKTDILPKDFSYGMIIKKKRSLKNQALYKQQKSIQMSGTANPMFNAGYKIAGSKNGHATIRYFFREKHYKCRLDLLKELALLDSKISTSTVRKLISGSTRVLREHPILKELSWEAKDENSLN